MITYRLILCGAFIILLFPGELFAGTLEDQLFLYPLKTVFMSKNGLQNPLEFKLRPISGFSIHTPDLEDFDRVTIIRSSNEEYSATYWLMDEVVYRASYQPVEQTAFLLQGNGNKIELQLSYKRFDPFNAALNVTRMLSSAFVETLKGAARCREVTPGECADGFIGHTEHHSYYQPYHTATSGDDFQLIESDQQITVILGDEVIIIRHNRNGVYLRGQSAKAVTNKGAEGGSGKQPAEKKDQSCSSYLSSGKQATLTDDAGNGTDSGGDGEEPPNRPLRKQLPADFMGIDEDAPQSKLQYGNYLAFVQNALAYVMHGEVVLDQQLRSIVNFWYKNPDDMVDLLLELLEYGYGIPQNRLAKVRELMQKCLLSPGCTRGFELRNESYYTSALVNSHLNELLENRSNVSIATEVQELIADLLSLFFREVIDSEPNQNLLTFIGENGLVLGEMTKEKRPEGVLCRSNCCNGYGHEFLKFCTWIFSSKPAIVMFAALFCTFIADNSSIFDGNVYVNMVLVYAMSVLSTGASVLSSFLNTFGLSRLLRLETNVSRNQVVLLATLNTTKDLFSILGLLCGMTLPDHIELVRFCQGINAIAGALFATALVNIANSVLRSIQNTKGLGSGRFVGCVNSGLSFIRFGDIALTAGLTLTTTALVQLISMNRSCLEPGEGFFANSGVSLVCNLLFPTGSTFFEVNRILAYAASFMAFLQLRRQYQVLMGMASDRGRLTETQRQHVRSMRRPVLARGSVSVLTLWLSFIDPYRHNPLFFWGLATCDFGKAICFESGVRRFRQELIAPEIYAHRRNHLREECNRLVSQIATNFCRSFSDYFQAMQGAVNNAGIRSEMNEINWLRHYMDADLGNNLQNTVSLFAHNSGESVRWIERMQSRWVNRNGDAFPQLEPSADSRNEGLLQNLFPVNGPVAPVAGPEGQNRQRALEVVGNRGTVFTVQRLEQENSGSVDNTITHAGVNDASAQDVEHLDRDSFYDNVGLSFELPFLNGPENESGRNIMVGDSERESNKSKDDGCADECTVVIIPNFLNKITDGSDE